MEPKVLTKKSLGATETPPPPPPITPPNTGSKRIRYGILMSVGFLLIIYIGVRAIFLLGVLVQVKCFNEILKIGYRIKKIKDIPHFRVLNLYFIFVANYLMFGETFIQHTRVVIDKYLVLQILARYHRFISFCLYFIGLIYFMVFLRKRIIREQFSLLFWTHFLLIIFSLQIFMAYQVMFDGIIWLLVPIWLVNINDIFAYFFGKNFGKTPLISVSPNKTVEGFVFGGVSTFIFGAISSYIFCHFQFLVCPVRYVEIHGSIKEVSNCTPGYLFQPMPFELGNTGILINYYPFLEHSFYMSIFASIIAPFGGFCASGFKRAVGVKDFDTVLSGHGGFTDRLDCQFLMMSFANVYMMTFVKQPDAGRIFDKVLGMSDERQLEFYLLLKKSLGDAVK